MLPTTQHEHVGRELKKGLSTLKWSHQRALHSATIITYKLWGRKMLGKCHLHEQEVLKKDDLRFNVSDR